MDPRQRPVSEIGVEYQQQAAIRTQLVEHTAGVQQPRRDTTTKYLRAHLHLQATAPMIAHHLATNVCKPKCPGRRARRHWGWDTSMQIEITRESRYTQNAAILGDTE